MKDMDYFDQIFEKILLHTVNVFLLARRSFFQNIECHVAKRNTTFDLEMSFYSIGTQSYVYF